MVINNLDFTIETYKRFLNTLSNQGFSFSTFGKFVLNPHDRVFILRHDVDSLPGNSLQFAKIQAEKGIKGSYYFRTVPGSFDEKIIKEIYSLGHEVGYHYEDLGAMAQRCNGVMAEEELVKIAIKSFASNLEKLRRIVPVKTICMHGSPMSRWDSRLLWKYYDYHDFGITGEPYFDIDFDRVMYLTDTGRCWDGDSFNVRDKSINRKDHKVDRKPAKETYQSPITDHRSPFPKFHSTYDIIKAALSGKLPDQIMMTFHPQRWTDKPLPWVKELVWQNMKNVGKYFLVKENSYW
jgi:hypothetical protein